MADSNTRPAERPRSLRSFRSRSSLGRSRTRSKSRPRSPDSHLHRIYSAGFADDHGTYVTEHDQQRYVAQPMQDDHDSGAGSSGKVDGGDEEKGLEEVEAPEEDLCDDPEQHDLAAANGDADPEKNAPSLYRKETSKSVRSQRERDQDPNSVKLEGDEDPKNWTNGRKWAAVLVVSSFTFISPVSSSMVAPALTELDRDLGNNNEVVSQMFLSIFILAYAIGPLFLGPLSEVYGRVPVLQLANLFFLIFNLVCGFATNTAEMLVFRFLAGLGGSAPLAIGGGVLGDCFHPEQRGKAIGIYSLAPLIGPAVGPVAGGFIAKYSTWRWVFWSVSIVDAVVQISGLIFLQETWAPKLAENKVRRLKKETGNDKLFSALSRRETVVQKLKTSLVRPFKLLFTQPIIQIMAVYMAYLYGLSYLVIASFPTLWSDRYNEPVQIAGLNYIALAVGYTIGAQATARFNDWLYRRLKKRNNGVGRPEYRIPAMIPCAVLLPIAFFWYGWSAEAHLYWIMPDIGVALMAAAIIAGYYSIQNYVIDCYTKYAASAVAAISTMRSLAGFGFPLFAPAMYNALGYGWGNSVLAFVAIVIGVPAPLLFWKYGGQLRAKSLYAAG